MDNGELTIYVGFKLEAKNVDPLQTLQDVSSALNNSLSGFGSEFESITGSFGSGFSSAAELFDNITQSDKINLSMDANIDFAVSINLSLQSVQISALIHELSASFVAAISNDFRLPIDPFVLLISPNIVLQLEAENTAELPFDVFDSPGQLRNFSYGGSFMGEIAVQVVDDMPAEVTLTAMLPDITNAPTIDFDVKLNIDLRPIKSQIFGQLGDIADLSYPDWLKKNLPFLPDLNLGCIEKSGVEFLDQAVSDNATASISGFLNAIRDGCSSKSLALSGGYDSASEQLEMNIAVELEGSRNL